MFSRISSFSHAFTGLVIPSGVVRCMAKNLRMSSRSFIRRCGVFDRYTRSRCSSDARSNRRSVYVPW